MTDPGLAIHPAFAHLAKMALILNDQADSTVQHKGSNVMRLE